MIVKQRDARPEIIKALELQGIRAKDRLRKSACDSAASRLRADPTRQAATDLIDKHFGQSDEWAIIHDLRLCVGGHAVQLNHVLIHNSLDMVCLDSRFLDYGLALSERGRWHAINHKETRVIASPVNKMVKDIRMLRHFVNDRAIFPKRARFRFSTKDTGYVLTNPGLRICVAGPDLPEQIGVFSSDVLFGLLWKREQGKRALLRARLSADELYDFAANLADEHLPVFSDALLVQDSLVGHQTHALINSSA